MNNTEATTKEKILDAALDMFSIRGYTSVSIRDIGRAIGIKESSIYHHFTNKKDIFDHLLHSLEKLILYMKNNFDMVLAAVEEVGAEAFIKAGIAYVENFLLENRIYKIINVLILEKQTNEEAASYFHNILFEMPLAHHEQVFSRLKQKGLVLEQNSAALAAEYQAIILFTLFKYFSSSSKNTEECKAMARNELQGLLKRFYDRYFTKGE